MMTSVLVASPGLASHGIALARQLVARLRRWIERMQQDQREAYLVGAEDIFDLERRIRQLERGASLPGGLR